MSRNLNIFSILSFGISFVGFGISIQDSILQKKFVKIQERNEILEKQINELKIDELKNEITKTKVEYFRSSLDESHSKITQQLETIQKLEIKSNDQKAILNSQLEELNTENENMQNMVNEIIKYFNDDNNNNFLNIHNIIDLFTNFIENWYKLFSTLSFEQQYAIFHLSASLCILINLFNIISVLFGDQLINYFKLEERFPKLSFIFTIRRKLNKISLSFSFTIIIIIIFSLFYINSLVLINF